MTSGSGTQFLLLLRRRVGAQNHRLGVIPFDRYRFAIGGAFGDQPLDDSKGRVISICQTLHCQQTFAGVDALLEAFAHVTAALGVADHAIAGLHHNEFLGGRWLVGNGAGVAQGDLALRLQVGAHASWELAWAVLKDDEDAFHRFEGEGEFGAGGG